MKTHGAWQLQPEGCSTCPDDLEWDGAFPSDGDDPLARAAGTRYEPDPLPGAEPHRHQGLEPGSGWRWRTPAGFTITDAPAPVLS